jgi:hypothetical protein
MKSIIQEKTLIFRIKIILNFISCLTNLKLELFVLLKYFLIL